MGSKQASKNDSNLKVPEKDASDLIHTMAKAGISAIPLMGGSISEIFSFLITPSIQKRQEKWMQLVVEGLQRLEQEIDSFDIENLQDNEVFQSMVLESSRVAILTHIDEKLKMLRNAVLNSALPEAPDETRQKIFIQWLSEFTAWHIKILIFFGNEPLIAESSKFHGFQTDNLFGIHFDDFANALEENFPQLDGDYHLYRTIIRDLDRLKLISNDHPNKGMATRKTSRPEITPIAKSFLKFLESPLKSESNT